MQRILYIDLLFTAAIASSEAKSLEEAAGKCLKAICEALKWPVGHLYLPDESRPDELTSANIWHIENPEAYGALREISAITRFSKGTSLPGMVLETADAVWITDLSEEKLLRSDQLKDAGFVSGFAFPILIGTESVGVMEFFSLERLEPDPAILKAMKNIGTLLGRVVERQKLKNELEKNEALFGEAQELAQLGCWECDVSRTRLRWSEELYRICGMDPATETMTFGRFKERVPLKDWEEMDARLSRITRTGKAEHYEHRIIRTDGIERIIYGKTKPVLDSEGRVIKLTGISQDITELKTLENELREAERLAKQIYDISPDIITVYDVLAKRNIYVNKEISEVLGYSPMEMSLMNKNILRSIIHPDDLPLARKTLEEFLQLRDSDVKEVTYRIKDAGGNWRHLRIRNKVFKRTPEGVPFQVLSVGTDITQRKENEELLTGVLNSTSDGIEALRAVRDGEERIVDFEYMLLNESAERIMGYKEREMVGKKLKESHPDIKLDGLFEKYVRVVETGEPANFEQYYKSENLEYWFNIYAVKYLDGIVLSFTNITEQKKTYEMLLKRSEELIRINAELEKFAYVTAHDLQEPLRTITSFVQLLNKRNNDQLDVTGKEYIRYVVEGTKRMHAIINDLLTYSRLEVTSNSITEIDIGEVIRKAVSNLQQDIEEKRADIVLDTTMPVIRGETNQVTELFRQLISNALIFCKDGVKPEIRISAKPVDGSTWQFCVQDNGIGIDPRYFKKIFVLFQRLNQRDSYPGTGMGLAICKKIAENHNGSIWVTSEPGKGSVFCFTIKN